MPKTKVYYCNKSENFKVCGETNPENFPVGRYSTCKNCRNKSVREFNKEKKMEYNEEKNKVIDPSANIRYLIVDTIRNAPIIDGQSIEAKIKNNEYDISEVLCCNSDKIENAMKQIYLEFGKMSEKIKELEKEISDLKKIESK